MFVFLSIVLVLKSIINIILNKIIKILFNALSPFVELVTERDPGET